ncbi:uncharacterized protein FIBRA_02610 [Fibroporia radiculosa]|uniref:Uncharacterized protein n=1 Tax=Fibroporia radiculosa TaxID=599839 RepID=J4GN02_9APHY|nr:uncharacterized protein FIBRA_02610 [Fibroporia radiculosa]CCM00575.1 predicted protein [Fibroporia radiculosa]
MPIPSRVQILASLYGPPPDPPRLVVRLRPPSRVLTLPPELLYNVLAECIGNYLLRCFFIPPQSWEECYCRRTENPAPTLLSVAHQWREIMFVVLRDALGVVRAEDGSLPQNAWCGLAHVLEQNFLCTRDDSAAVAVHAATFAAAAPPPALSDVLRVLLGLARLEQYFRGALRARRLRRDLPSEQLKEVCVAVGRMRCSRWLEACGLGAVRLRPALMRSAAMLHLHLFKHVLHTARKQVRLGNPNEEMMREIVETLSEELKLLTGRNGAGGTGTYDLNCAPYVNHSMLIVRLLSSLQSSHLIS